MLGVDRYETGPGLEGRQRGDDVVGAAGELDRHPLLASGPVLAQEPGQAVRGPVEFPVGQSPVAGDDRDRLRCGGGLLGEPHVHGDVAFGPDRARGERHEFGPFGLRGELGVADRAQRIGQQGRQQVSVLVEHGFDGGAVEQVGRVLHSDGRSVRSFADLPGHVELRGADRELLVGEVDSGELREPGHAADGEGDLDQRQP